MRSNSRTDGVGPATDSSGPLRYSLPFRATQRWRVTGNVRLAAHFGYAAKMPLPPKFLGDDFDVLGSLLEFDVAKNFGRKIQALHAFLNADSAVSNAHEVRRREWKARARGEYSFENHGFEDRHWYTFNAGGRNEAQLNVGMFGGENGHVRVGLGFEMTERKGGQPAVVQFIYTAFVKLLKSRSDVAQALAKFVQDEGLELEFLGPSSSELEIVSTADVLEFLTSLTRTTQWVFLGKLLRRKADAEILAEPASLAATIDRVFRGLLPAWREANVIGSAG